GSGGRAGEAERELLLEGGLRRIYAGLPEERVEHYLRRFSSPGALTAALNWYRAMRPPAVRGPVSVPTMYVWSTGDEFIGPVAARAAGRFVRAPDRFEGLEGVAAWVSEEGPGRPAALLFRGVGGWGGGARGLRWRGRDCDVRLWPIADISYCTAHVCFWAACRDSAET